MARKRVRSLIALESIPAHVAPLAQRVLDCSEMQTTERAATERAFEALYRAAGLPWHGHVIWVPSPLVGALAVPQINAKLRAYRREGKVRARLGRPRQCASAHCRAWLQGLRRLRATLSVCIPWTLARLEHVIATAAISLAISLVASAWLAWNWYSITNYGFWPLLGLSGGWLLTWLTWRGDDKPSGLDEVIAGGVILSSFGLIMGMQKAMPSPDAPSFFETLIPFAHVLATLGTLAGLVVGCIGKPTRHWHVEKLLTFEQLGLAPRGRTVRDRILRAAHDVVATSVLRRYDSGSARWSRQRAHGEVNDRIRRPGALLSQSVHEAVLACGRNATMPREVGVALRRAFAPLLRGPAELSISHFDPQLWASGLPEEPAHFHGAWEAADAAWARWLREHADLRLAPDAWAGAEAFAAASCGQWFWAERDYVVISERPAEMHTDRLRGEQVLHRRSGPALRFRDGFCVYASHGELVPESVMEREWDIESIHAHQDYRVRRAAIERMGLATYVRKAALPCVGTAPDPGNPPHRLELYAGNAMNLGRHCILLMTNASPDVSGRHQEYAELVPSHLSDPVRAAAWQFDCSLEDYAALKRRT